MSKEARDLRSKQLNPLSPHFLKSRTKTLTSIDVKTIQKAEVKSKGSQTKDGLGALAQKKYVA